MHHRLLLGWVSLRNTISYLLHELGLSLLRHMCQSSRGLEYEGLVYVVISLLHLVVGTGPPRIYPEHIAISPDLGPLAVESA